MTSAWVGLWAGSVSCRCLRAVLAHFQRSLLVCDFQALPAPPKQQQAMPEVQRPVLDVSAFLTAPSSEELRRVRLMAHICSQTYYMGQLTVSKAVLSMPCWSFKAGHPSGTVVFETFADVCMHAEYGLSMLRHGAWG
jgi:hypothetical protein